MSMQINCNEFADTMKDILKIVAPGSSYLDDLYMFSQMVVCDDTVDMVKTLEQEVLLLKQ